MEAHSFRRKFLHSKKSFARIAKTALMSIVFLSVLFGNLAPIFAQAVIPTEAEKLIKGHSDEYLNLFGSFTPDDAQIKKGLQSGVAYAGPGKIDAQTGEVKTFQLAVTLNFTDQTTDTIIKDWNKITSHRLLANGFFNNTNCTSVTGPIWRFLDDDSFVMRTYALNADGTPDLSSAEYIDLPKDSCIGSDDTAAIAQGKPSKKIFKYLSQSLLNALNNAGGTVGNWFTSPAVYTSPDDLNDLYLAKAQNLVTEIPNKNLAPGTQLGVDLWYCTAVEGSTDILDADLNADLHDTNPRVQNFKNKCSEYPDSNNSGQGSYVQIGKSITITVPTATQAQAQVNDPNNQISSSLKQANANASDGLPVCSWTNGFFGSGTLVGCAARLIYYVVYIPISWFAGLMGTLFDFFLGYSLSDASYRAAFAVRGWQLVRDISNIFFIIILVWTGLSTVFNTKTNMKRVIPNLILNALIINFSLFATRVIIDTSNIVARVFYNQVHVCQGPCQSADTDGTISNLLTGPGGYKSLSTKIVSAFNPQKLFAAKVLDTSKAIPTLDAIGSQHAKANTDTETATYFIVVSLIAAFILFGVAMMFWKTTFFFLGRVIGLYVGMIFSPFAFLSRGNIPLVSGIKELSWDSWLKDITGYALLAPIFVFFLYIIYSFLQTDFMTVYQNNVSNSNSFFETVIYIAIPMLIVYFMIKQGVDIAKKYAGKIGEGIQGLVDKTVGGIGGVVGGGVGIAAGGAALGLRGASTFLNQGVKKIGLTDWAASNAEGNWAARQLNKGLRWSQTSSMDVRNAGIKIGKKEFTAGATFNKTLGYLGAKPDYKLADSAGLGQKAFIGGNMKIRKDRKEQKEKDIKKAISYDHIKNKDAAGVWEAKKNRSMEEAGERNWQKHVADDKNVQTKTKPLNDEIEKLKKEQGELQQNLENAKGSQFEEMYKEKLDENKESQDKLTTQLSAIIAETLVDLKKDDKYKDSNAYELARDEEKLRLDKFGEINDTKKLNSAMRSEYARNLRENSFWMKGGEPRWGLSTGGGLGADIALNIAGLNAAISGGIGAIFGGHIKELQNSFDEASETVMDEHKKTVKGSNLGKLEDELKNINNKLKKELEASYPGRTFKNVDEDASAEEVEKAIIAGIAKRNKKIRELQTKLQTPAGLTNDEELELAQADKERNDLKRLETERDNKRDKIDQIKKKATEDETKKKKGDGGEDKPKDDKPKESSK